ncbi:MAG: DegT/DnrJ/EryC1/StrS aminotransferase family protein [Chloroflexota bacterium]|nr:DegT/DnrJ/EryC1/StrS aminotransferase family protein [Chloroflexota bacterium]
MGLPRRVALLGGTTTLADCAVAARYLADPRGLVKGPAIEEYEECFAQTVGVRHAYSFSAGRVALYGLLRALGIGPGDEVLLQVPTHIVVANAIRYVGARPVYVDCRPETCNMDLKHAESLVTPRTRVLILQHTFGMPADFDQALALADRHGLILIEDCVHALGAKYDGRQVGSFGRAAFFSTEETKTISSTMGGMALTDDPELAVRLQAFQASCAWPSATLTARYVLKLVLYHVLTQPHLHRYTRTVYERLGRRNPLPGPTTGEEVVGARPRQFEQRLSNAQAVLAIRQLRRLQSNLAHRRRISEMYRERLSQIGFDVANPPAGAEPALVRYPVWVADRAAAVDALSPSCVPGTWFTSVLEEAVSPAHGGYVMGSCPQAELAAKHLINLPTHPRVEACDVEAIISALTAVQPRLASQSQNGEAR